MRLLLSFVVFMLTYLAVGLALIRVGAEFSNVLLVGGAVAAVAAVLSFFLSEGMGNEP